MSDAGLFGPGSLTWRVNREGVLLVGGGAALVLQVAHPLVAAGVAEHSNYREDPWGRLYRTLDLTTKIVFGSTATAREASDRIKDVHGRVKGVTVEDGGRYPAGTRYDARDPELLMWVHATLVRTSLDVYTRYVGRLTIAEQQGYYEEQKTLGEMFGVPRDRQPETFADFNAYFADMLASDRLAVTNALRDVVDATLRPRLPLVARPVVEALSLATVGHLPEPLRSRLGLPWGPTRRRVFEASRIALSAALPVLPRLVREFPPARGADRRVRAAATA
ncbi:MAG TPA: oxygenase MpaB family protein [Thermoleophilaceae bacterium]